MSTFFAATWPTFFIRVSPASRNAKPACMNMTSTAATTTQIVEAAIARSLLLTRPTSSSGRPVRLCIALQTGVVQTIPSPDSCPVRAVSTIVSTTASARSSVDDEDQQRLREEARLEDAAAVLVRDPAAGAPCPTASITVTPTWPVRSVTASITSSTLSRTTTASTLS